MIIVYILIVLVLFGVHTYYHEAAHISICNKYGGNATPYFSLVKSGVSCDVSTVETMFLNEHNEIVGYNNMSLLLAISVLPLLLLLLRRK